MSDPKKRCFVYLLHCGDDSFYCGWTNDIVNRLRAHQTGHGAKYTKSHQPVELAYLEEAEDVSGALKREAALKKLSHKEKLQLITQGRGNTFSLLHELAFPDQSGNELEI